MDCQVFHLAPAFELEPHQVTEVLRLLLHTIIFQRALGPVKPQERDSELFDVTWVECGDAEVSRRVDEHIAQFLAWLQRNPGKRGQVCLSFYEKRQRQSWFSTAEERVYWEQWLIDVQPLALPAPEFEEREALAAAQLRTQRRARVQAAIEECLTSIVRHVNEKRDHIPPVVSGSAVTFPFDISVAGDSGAGFGLDVAGMQPADAAALAAAGPARLCGRDRGRRITSSGVAAGSILPIGGPTAAAAPPLPPMSPVAAAALPVLRAAEAALEAKLAGNAAACDADFMQLHILNERLARELRFTAAEARRDLNRYCDVLPFDSNRVRLGQPAFERRAAVPAGGAASGVAAADSGASDAEACAGRSSSSSSSSGSAGAPGDVPAWAYIASQGPLRHTRDAFWQVAVEQRCSTVVMLTNTVERGVPKCAAYFADAPRTAKALGRYTVSTLSCKQVLPDLELRQLAVKDTTQGGSTGQLKRSLDGMSAPSAEAPAAPAHRSRAAATLQHYHYTAWPDHGVPTSPEPLLRLCGELRRSGAHGAPIVVHCSAGIGRSGVFCVLDIITRRLLHLLDGHPAASGAAGAAGQEVAAAAAAAAAVAVDVAALVADLRRQRGGMVQTREQYVFCHTALLHFVRQLAAARQPEPRQAAHERPAADASARRLLQEDCSDIGAVLAPFTELKSIATLVTDFDLLPGGVPSGATIFLPTNEGVEGLVATVNGLLGLNATIDTLADTVGPLASVAAPKLTSAILYHIALGDAWMPEELVAAGTIETALAEAQNDPKYSLTFAGNNGTYTITDLAGQTVNIQGDPIDACGSMIYFVDKVMLPAAGLLQIPDTTAEAAAERPGSRQCADLHAFFGHRHYSHISGIGKLIEYVGLLQRGIPPDVTLFLPTNAALDAFLRSGTIPLPTYNVDQIVSRGLAPEVADRLLTLLLYHVVPGLGALPNDEVAEMGRLETALPGYTLGGVSRGHGWRPSLVDAQGGMARLRDPRFACGAALYPIDRVLLPAPFSEMARAKPSDALCFITGEGC
ncbi:Meiotically up-regulated 66 [Micractinium conductrix]|uniref:Meiotically up-regulated 66 n=1 Tax=Micractinium conductrix TaxID=554055 RepID=A0A2P6V6Q8_9CHLO|nr:Meiotically up-regulated 66 [Micractinium conductrix]|eukprot:PSC69772.1 Meiotically up-regulated 66 [Micractinium conductrix]